MKLKKLLSLFVVLGLGMMMAAGCASRKPFEIRDITMSEAASKMDEKETFVLMFERDNCPYCQALNDYIEKTKGEHPDTVIYRVDATSFELFREQEGDMALISNSDDGKELLKRFPYYLYTPAIYLIQEGVPTQVGVGFDETNDTVSVWEVTSTINWDQAEAVNVWDFIARGQAQDAQNSNLTENEAAKEAAGDETAGEDQPADNEDQPTEETTQEDQAAEEINPETGDGQLNDSEEDDTVTDTPLVDEVEDSPLEDAPQEAETE